ncbi:MAG: hypothetical protein ACRDDY_14225 [Clostridium sp.]|uniref:hypothetical protein n=2 Tax=Bacteria TaxID=2 RepID=UPI003EE4AF80
MLYFKDTEHFINYCKKYNKNFTEEYFIDLTNLINLGLEGNKQAINFIKKFSFLLKNANENKDELIKCALLLKEFKTEKYKNMLEEIPVFNDNEAITKAELILERKFSEEFKAFLDELSLQVKSGLFLFWQNRDEIAYIGESKDIGGVLFSTLKTKKFDAELVSIVELDNPIDIKLIKLYYVSKLKPHLNKADVNEYSPSFDISYNLPKSNLIKIFDLSLDDFI